MPYKRSRRTVFPMNPTDRDTYLSRLKEPHPDWMPMYDLNPRQVVLFLYHTGCHPDIMVHPSMRLLSADQVTNMINWARPKNDRTMGIPIHPDLRPWVFDFVESLKLSAPPCELTMSDRSGRRHSSDKTDSKGRVTKVKDSTPYCLHYQRIWRIVKQVSEQLGFPGVTPRTLRHTFAARVWKRSEHNVEELKKWIGTTSADVTIRYGESEDTELGQDFAEGRF